MVAPVENRTLLTGRVVGQRPDGTDRVVLSVEVAAAEELPGMPNLLAGQVGQTIEVALDAASLPDTDLTGWDYRGPVRVGAPGRVFAVAGDGAGAVLSPPP